MNICDVIADNWKTEDCWIRRVNLINHDLIDIGVMVEEDGKFWLDICVFPLLSILHFKDIWDCVLTLAVGQF